MSPPHLRHSAAGMPFHLLLGLFALSGATGLVYEVVWARSLHLMLGATAYAVSVVLACFMGGLALGAVALGRVAGRASNPLRMYAYLELGIGAYALLFPLLADLGDLGYAAVGRAFDLPLPALTALRVGFASALLLLPTALMGGTFPVLVQAAAQADRAWAGRAGALYAANTLGAVAGCLLAGYLLLPALGARSTASLAAAVNLCIGAGILLFVRRVPEAAPTPAGSGMDTEGRKPSYLFLFLFGLAGAASMACEVLWTRLLTPAFHATTYSFTAMLAAFLIGIGLGSALIAPRADRLRRPLDLLGWIEAGIGAAVLLSSALLWDRVTTGFPDASGGWAASEFTKGVQALALMLVPAALMGAAFPLAVRACAGGPRTPGGTAGAVYAASTAGAVAGSLAAGFLVIPYLGLRAGIPLAAAVNLCVGLVLLIAADRRRIWRPALAAGLAALAVLPYGLLSASRPPGTSGRLLYDREGASGRVTVVRTGLGARILSFNGKKLGGTDVALTERTFAHLPILLGPRPDTVAVIGLGSGATLSAAAAHPVDRIDCLEISPEVVDAARFFADALRGALHDPRVSVRIEDGRNYLLRAPARYDLILSDIFHPENAGAGNLYTREHYRLCRARLRPGGRMAQWIPLSQMAPHEVRSVILSFAAAFPHVTAWFGDLYALSPTLLLLGSADPYPIRMEDLRARLTPAVAADLPAAPDAVRLLGLFIAGREALVAYADGATANTDDNAYLEFSTPRNTWREADNALANFAALGRLRTSAAPFVEGLTHGDLSRLAAARRLRDGVAQGQILRARGRLADARAAYARAAQIDPSDPILALCALDLGDACRATGDAGGALRAYRMAADLAPEDARAHNGQSAMYLRLGRMDSARTAAERAVALSPDWPDGHCSLGNARLKGGDAEGARRAYEAALKREPDYAPALRNLSMVHLMGRDYGAAAGMLNRLLAVVPEDTARRYELAVAYAMAGDREAARREIGMILEIAGDAPEAARARLLLKQLEKDR